MFSLLRTLPDSAARAGELTTDHGNIPTPIFMPVGTAGTVKAVHQRELVDDIHAKIILGNTYHLYLRPGLPILEGAGGLHKFIHWDHPILTDSGGYQVYSLPINGKSPKRASPSLPTSTAPSISSRPRRRSTSNAPSAQIS